MLQQPVSSTQTGSIHRPWLCLSLRDSFKNIGREAFGLHLAEDLLDVAICSDQVGDAMNPIVDLAHKLLLSPGLVRFDHGAGFIRQKWIGKLVFIGELLLFSNRVFAYPEDLYT